VKVVGRRGRSRLRLDQQEVALLTRLFDELDEVLDGAAAPAVLERLSPAAYRDDTGAQDEFRELTAGSLRTERGERIALCRADLAASSEVDVADPEVADRWLKVLNDVRLALGTQLGITEDDDHDVDPADPEQQPRLVYYWLTAVQDAVVRAVMG
jgi:hypothetical protein